MQFESISNIDVKPDSTKTIPSELKIEWMANKINKLHISGDRLQETFFINDKKCHPYLIIWQMEAKYTFDDHVAKGHCRINFEFSKARHNSELSIDVSSVTLDKKFKHVDKTRVKKHLLEQVGQLKLKLFKEHAASTKSKPEK